MRANKAMGLAGAAAAVTFTSMAPAATAEQKIPVQSSITAVRTDDARDVINCAIDKQVPHKSTHDPTTVNVVAKLTCSKPVAKINANVKLYKAGALASDSGPVEISGKPTLVVNAAAPCINDTYGSWRGYTVTFPPGYNPPTQSWPTNPQDGYTAPEPVNNC